jgi:hypothetical protein
VCGGVVGWQGTCCNHTRMHLNCEVIYLCITFICGLKMLKLWLICAFIFLWYLVLWNYETQTLSILVRVVCHNTSVCKRIITPHKKDGLCASTAGEWHDYSRVHGNSMAIEMLEGWGIWKGSNIRFMIWLQASSGCCVRGWKSVKHCTNARE